MADKTISILHAPAGVPTDYDAVPYLRDAGNTYGVRRVSDSAVILAPTALTQTGTGAYAITVTGLVEGTAYECALERTYLGTVRRTLQQFTVPGTGPETVSITESLPEPATAVSLIALTRADTGLTPAGVTLPLAFTDQGGGTAWGVSFTDPDALPARYDFTFRVTWPDGSTSDVVSSQAVGGAVGFWTTQAQVEATYGVDSPEQDADLSNTGAGVAAVWQRALDSTDARIDLLIAGYGKARPLTQSGTAYTFVSEVAAAQVRYILHKGRGQTESNPAGGANVGGVFKQEAADLWEELEEYLENGSLDFPDVLDSSGAVAGTAPQILRPSMDAEGRPLAIAGNFDRPYYDPNLGAYRN